jgi:DNA-binding NtrC family response regulator
MTHRILVAEDDELMRNYLVKVFRKVPWEVEIARDGREAIEQSTSRVFDIAVLDNWMPNYTGFEVLEIIRRRGVGTDVVLLTGQGTIELAVDAMKAGACDFITKPVEPRDAVRIVGEILARRRPSPNILARRIRARKLEPHRPAPGRYMHPLCHFRALRLPSFQNRTGHDVSPAAGQIPHRAGQGAFADDEFVDISDIGTLRF